MMRALLFTAVALFGVACKSHNYAVSSGPEASNGQAVRIIIGFSGAGFDYSHPAFLETLSRDLDAEVTFLHPLSGKAALYLCRIRDPIDTFFTRLQNLSARSDIEYAEPDQKRMKQNKPY